MNLFKWKSIKSAPRDGTRILLYAKSKIDHAYYMAPGYYDDSPKLSNYDSGPWEWGLTIKPTHWMPLPEPPKTKS